MIRMRENGATIDELKEKGHFNQDTMSLVEVLLTFEQVDSTFFNNVVIEGSKFQLGTGAIGVESTFHFKEGKWKMKESKEICVS